MTTAFQVAIDKIRDQQHILWELDERAVEVGVILPLLKRVGWDTEDLQQIYPQEGFDSSKKKVDYALKSDGVSQIFIEAKRWKTPELANEEEQLQQYCIEARERPKLAVLTNGRQWRLYYTHKKSRKKGDIGLRQFLVFDITSDDDDDEEVEQQFKKFLSPKSISSISIESTLGVARSLYTQATKKAAVRKASAEALDDLMANRGGLLAEVLEKVVEDKGFHTNQAQLEEFLASAGIQITKVSPKKSKAPVTKPKSFTFSANGEEETVPVEKWAHLNLKLCELMHARHPKTFGDKVLTISKYWFSKTSDNVDGHVPVSNSGVSVRTHGSADNIKKTCKKVVDSFDYPEGALTIQET